MIRLFVSVILGLFSISAAAQEADIADAQTAARDLGVPQGETAPSFNLPDQFGEIRSLADLAGPEGLVLYFNRSVDWCPYCLRQALEVDEMQQGFLDAGYGVAILTHDDFETNARVAGQRDIAVTLLADPDHEVIDAFDVRDPTYDDPDSRGYGVPFPITFILAPDGTVKAKYWHEPGYGEERGYRPRVAAADIIAALEDL